MVGQRSPRRVVESCCPALCKQPRCQVNRGSGSTILPCILLLPLQQQQSAAAEATQFSQNFVGPC